MTSLRQFKHLVGDSRDFDTWTSRISEDLHHQIVESKKKLALETLPKYKDQPYYDDVKKLFENLGISAAIVHYSRVRQTYMHRGMSDPTWKEIESLVEYFELDRRAPPAKRQRVDSNPQLARILETPFDTVQASFLKLTKASETEEEIQARSLDLSESFVGGERVMFHGKYGIVLPPCEGNPKCYIQRILTTQDGKPIWSKNFNVASGWYQDIYRI